MNDDPLILLKLENRVSELEESLRVCGVHRVQERQTNNKQRQTILTLEATVAVMRGALKDVLQLSGDSCPSEILTVVHNALSQSAPTDMLGKVREAVWLLLPLAKGYAHSKQVDSNWKMIETAERVLELLPNEKK